MSNPFSYHVDDPDTLDNYDVTDSPSIGSDPNSNPARFQSAGDKTYQTIIPSGIIYKDQVFATETTEEVIEDTVEEETTEEKIVEEKPVIKQLSLNFEDASTIKPAERRFLDWWDGLTTEQRTKVSEGALGKTGAVTGQEALAEFNVTMSEVNDKLIERLKCYI